MKQKQNFCHDGGPWLSGNIRRRLTLSVIIMCFTLVGIFLYVSIFMLQPAYYNSIRTDLTSTLEATLRVMNKAQRNGINMTQGGSLSEGMINELQQAVDNGTLNLENRCLDIGSIAGQNIFLRDPLTMRCLLHPQHETGVMDNEVWYAHQRDGLIITQIRQQVLETGSFENILNDTQIIMGGLTDDGQYTVVVSANLERIPQAVEVLKRLMVPVSCILVLVGIIFAWGFSRWFTRPLSRLSAAAKEMAKGNYDVQVEPVGNDEITALTCDFNTMVHEVKRSADLQKDLIANISHDLRTPLTLIKGYAETVRDLTGEEPEKRTEQLNVIVDETDRLSALVNSVMEFSRMSSGNEKLSPVVFDLYQLADEVTFRYDALCNQNGYTFEFVGEEGCVIEADPDMIERALHNLLGNALQHVGADGYIGLHLHKQPAGIVRLEVIDHGPGIAEEDQPHLFDRYYRSRSDAGKPGTGLGLSITKAIFEAHGFSYGVQSRLNEGATFWFEAPLVKEK